LKTITLLGATGSVGRSALELIADHPDQFRVGAVTANRDVTVLAAQARATGARLAVVADPACYAELKSELSGSGIETAAGAEAVIAAAAGPSDLVLSAIVGAAGLKPTLAAIEAGIPVALANKEALVCAGPLVLAAALRTGVALLPVDSEHSAIFQVFDATQRDAIDRLVLTASGGPFRTASNAAMQAATPADAVNHPIWSMGAKISVDSATMMNKGLEIIEAHFLFAMPEDRIDVVVHPQSVVHSLVEYRDGSVLAQMGHPDMRTPLAVAFAWPRRLVTTSPRLDLASVGRLTFEAVDDVKFPALRLARHALRAGGAAPTVLNAANEIAVAAFLAGRIGFLDIARLVERALQLFPAPAPASVDEVIAVDQEARQRTLEWIAGSQPGAGQRPVAVRAQ
jgi:1-deoxy-D-xylulose-5-phosphate reductoisomerase